MRYREALDTIDLALEGVRDVSDRGARTSLSYMAWKSRAFTASWMGLWRESVEAYRRVISFEDRGPYEDEHSQSGPGDPRELSSMHFRVGDYAESLSLLEEAEELLRRYEPKLHRFVRDDERARM